MKTSFAIIGCGATALSFLHRLLDHVDAGRAQSATIYVFEKRDIFGCGAAYEPDLTSNILNTKTAYITPFPDLPGHFKTWLDANKEKWRNAFPSFTAELDSYAPRPLFGLYLAEQMQAIILRGATLDVQIVTLRAEVQDIEFKESGHVIHTSCGVMVSASKSFLFCGTLSRKTNTIKHDSRINDTPYPLSGFLNVVHPDEDVGIIGARLSAIDTAIALIEAGHRGKVCLHSRSGFLPTVRGTQGRIHTNWLSAEGIRALVAERGLLEVSDIVHLFRKEMELHDPTFNQRVVFLPTPPPDIQKYLKEEIEAARNPRIWQAVLYATNGFVEVIWQALSSQAQSKFLSDSFSLFMTYRVSIPSENAKKILGYLEEGRLEFITGQIEEPESREDGIVLRSATGEYCYDRIVYATGSPRDTNLLDSNLIYRLINKGVLTRHPMGGIHVDIESCRVLGSDTQRSVDVYAVGELTVGQNFFTSALEINARHAYRCADLLHEKPAIARTFRGQLRKREHSRNGSDYMVS